jgi:hypothetical protein
VLCGDVTSTTTSSSIPIAQLHALRVLLLFLLILLLLLLVAIACLDSICHDSIIIRP